MATGINTLKKWFSTGLKPTQDQFWAWLDSYWHKDEKIPMQNIEGIDTALENKAETTAVDAKANADASGLGEDNVLKWKEALGVGEIPKNMAKIDTESEQGNVYDKTQVDDLLENSGKNIANSKLTSVAGAGLDLGDVWSIKTNGFPFRIEDLPDVTNRPTHRKKIMIGDDNTAGISDKADISFELPNTMTVNHIYPQINEPVAYPAELAEFLKTYRTKQFTQMREEDWFYNYNENALNSKKTFANGVMILSHPPKIPGDRLSGNWSLMSKKFPFNKKFIINLYLSANIFTFHSHGYNSIGICQNGNENSFNQNFSDFFNFSSERIMMGGKNIPFKNEFRAIIAHVENTLFMVAFNGEGGGVLSKISNISDFFGDFSILLKNTNNPFGSENRCEISMEYWIED